MSFVDRYDPKDYIIIKGARMHNLKGVDVAIPRKKFTVITGLSGSGKSSLAFDTLYADGQRRYVESLSSYARQFLGRMQKPDVDYIKGISPAIAIEQRVNTRNPRSTVGTSTEVYEYLKLLFARIGRTFSPVSGEEVKRDRVEDVIHFIKQQKEGLRFIIAAPFIVKEGRDIDVHLDILKQQGFSRLLVDGDILPLEELKGTLNVEQQELYLLIDRLVTGQNGVADARLADSVQTAFYEGNESCVIILYDDGKTTIKLFSSRYEADGIVFEEPSVNLFTFNNPYGACKRCEGYGSIIGIDEDLVIPDTSRSVYEEAIACWRGEKMSEWKDELVMSAHKFDFPIHTPYIDLTEEQRELLWKGNRFFKGIDRFFKHVESQTYKIQYRVMLSRYRGKTVCPDCKGTRLRKDAAWVKINGKSIRELVLMPIDELSDFFKALKIDEHDQNIAKRIITEIDNRLGFLMDVGLGYLTLNRRSNTLSGGESQRINLATSLGSSLVGSMYILDEPTIGLHPRDTNRLLRVLKRLRDIGNTVIVVEHDETVMRNADHIIDIGPDAGVNGGNVIFSGTVNELTACEKSITAKYLNGTMRVPVNENFRPWRECIEVIGARENNLKNINVKFPLGIITAVTGVSGSGKTTLVKNIFYTALKKIYGGYAEKTGKFEKISGDYNKIEDIEMIDQNPLGKSSRSNPATYIKVYDEIRMLYASQKLSRLRGYKPGFFSFNVEGGRCEVCQGEGVVRIEMQFMADIVLTCENCAGKRFKEEVLDVTYEGKNIADILAISVDEAVDFFSQHAHDNNAIKRIIDKLTTLQDVGLGYIALGQASSTLSGGEAQRVKLAWFLSKGGTEKPSVFLFDEPTTGLHFHDIARLKRAFDALIAKGHTIVVIEHNPDMIRSADWIIDLGPDGGDKGGNVVFEGTPEEVKKCNASYTGYYLANK